MTELLTAAEVEEVGRDLEHLGFRVVTGSGGSWADADIWLSPTTAEYAALTRAAERFMNTIALIQHWPEQDQEEAWQWAMEKARAIVPAEFLPPGVTDLVVEMPGPAAVPAPRPA